MCFDQLKEVYIPLILEIFSIALPTVFTLLLECLIPVFSIIMIGHFGEKFLAAGSLANMIVNASGYSITLGMANALDTLCPNAFGAKQYKLTGLHAQRGMLILTLTSLPIIGFWFFTEKILVLGNVNVEISYLAQQWVYWQMISIIPKNLSNAFQKFLFAQSIVIPQISSVVASSGVYALAAYLLMYHTELGFLGAAIAVPITEVAVLIFMVTVYFFYYLYQVWKRSNNLLDAKSNRITRTLTGNIQNQRHSEELVPFMIGGNEDEDNQLSNNDFNLSNTNNYFETLSDKDLSSLTINSFIGNSNDNEDNTGAHLYLKAPTQKDTEREEKKEKQSTIVKEAEEELKSLDTWHSPFTMNIFKGWWEFIKLG
jgi:MATE family multidrug resistance protein